MILVQILVDDLHCLLFNFVFIRRHCIMDGHREPNFLSWHASQHRCLWANIGGSLIMGFFSEDKELFRFKEMKCNYPTAVTPRPPAIANTTALIISGSLLLP